MQDRVTKEIRHGRFLAKYGAGEIWNWESPAGKLRWARRVKMLSKHLGAGMRVLELGCGTGYFTRELARSRADIVAIDVSPELLEIARANCSGRNVRYEIQNASALSYPDGVFDSVVGSSVLHHLEIEEALREIHRVLKAGGTIYFTEPNMLNATPVFESEQAKDRAATLRNCARLGANKNISGIANFTVISSKTFRNRRHSRYSR